MANFKIIEVSSETGEIKVEIFFGSFQGAVKE
jgi:hypothetical protein